VHPLPLLRCFALVSCRYWQLNFIMPSGRSLSCALSPPCGGAVLILICFAAVALVQAQGAKQSVPENPISDADGDRVKERSEWSFPRPSGPWEILRGSSSTCIQSQAVDARAARCFLPYALWLFLPGFVIGWGSRRSNDAKRKVHRLGSIIVLVLVTLSLLSCNRVSTGGGTTSSSGNQPVTDYITVTGTSPGVTPDAGQSA
jgi:hypothetical protein